MVVGKRNEIVNTPVAQHEIRGIITEIRSFTTHDGPGIRTTVFVKGCPLRCRWCANPETWVKSPQIFFRAKKCRGDGECYKVCPEGAILMGERRIDREKCTGCMQCVDACPYGGLEKIGMEMTAVEVAEKVAADKPFFDNSGGGVTVSGGEPLSQARFTAEVMRICHEKGIHTCLDTSGYAPPESLLQVLEHTDLVFLDIKLMDAEKHRKWTGVSNDQILENARIIAEKCQLRISIPLVTGVNDDAINIRALAEFAQSLGVEFIDVEPFHKLGESKYLALDMESPYSQFSEIPEEKVEEVNTIIGSYGLKTTKGRAT